MESRRTFTATIAALALAPLSGCLSVVRGDEPLEFTAGPLRVPDAVLEDTGYEFVRRHGLVIEETFEVGEQSRDVVVTNQLAEHEKSIDFGPLGSVEAAVFVVLSTPSVSVLGREFNPVAEFDTRELAELVIERYDELDGISHVGDRSVEIGGQDTTVSTFTTATEVHGHEVDVDVHVSQAVPIGEDLTVAVGAHPEIAQDEAGLIRTMMRAIEPGV